MTTHSLPAKAGLLGPGFFLRRLAHGIAELADSTAAAIHCARETERLLACSDAELARMCLARDQVVHHVFRTWLDRA